VRANDVLVRVHACALITWIFGCGAGYRACRFRCRIFWAVMWRARLRRSGRSDDGARGAKGGSGARSDVRQVLGVHFGEDNRCRDFTNLGYMIDGDARSLFAARK